MGEKRKSDISEPSNILVPKRAKTSNIINLKAKSEERAKKDKLESLERDLDKAKRELKREESSESRLRHDKDDVLKSLRRKKDEGKGK